MSVKTHNKTKLVPVNRSVALLPERDASISPILECIDLGVTFGGVILSLYQVISIRSCIKTTP